MEVEEELPEELGQEEAEEEVGKQTVEVPEVGEADRPEYEVHKHRIARRPSLPTKAEIDEHYPLCLNYRSWCAHSVAGKARSNQHVISKEDKVRLGVTWNADYVFMSGEHNEGEHGMQPALRLYN